MNTRLTCISLTNKKVYNHYDFNLKGMDDWGSLFWGTQKRVFVKNIYLTLKIFNVQRN